MLALAQKRESRDRHSEKESEKIILQGGGQCHNPVSSILLLESWAHMCMCQARVSNHQVWTPTAVCLVGTQRCTTTPSAGPRNYFFTGGTWVSFLSTFRTKFQLPQGAYTLLLILTSRPLLSNLLYARPHSLINTPHSHTPPRLRRRCAFYLG